MKLISMKSSSGKYLPLKIKHRCQCGTKVLIEDTGDIFFIRKSYMDNHVPQFGYLCPNCEQTCELSDWQNFRISRKMKRNGINLEKYEDVCDHISDEFEFYAFKKAFGEIDGHTLVTYLKSHGLNERMKYIIDNSLPIPKGIQDLILSGELIID